MSVSSLKPRRVATEDEKASFHAPLSEHASAPDSTSPEERSAEPKVRPGDSRISADSLSRSARTWGKDTSWDILPRPKSPLLDTPEARAAQRLRLRRIIADIPATSPEARTFATLLSERLEIAETYDLLILDSGNLYYGGHHLREVALSDGDEVLHARVGKWSGRGVILRRGGSRTKLPSTQKNIAADALEWSHRVYLGENERPFFSYDPLMKSAAVYVSPEPDATPRPASAVEIGRSIANLPALPEDYLDHIAFPDKAKGFSLPPIPEPRRTVLDFKALGEEKSVKKTHRRIALLSYDFDIGGKRITLEIPDPASRLHTDRAKQGWLIVGPDQLPRLLGLIAHLIPVGLLPPESTLTFVPIPIGSDTNAFLVDDSARIIFSGRKTDDGNEWLKEVFIDCLQHEFTHVMHQWSPAVSALLLRCMLLDGWTMEYGDTNIVEYLAVLAENFFDHPENRDKFPNGYRLFYALIKMREPGLDWDSKTVPEPLAKLRDGLPIGEITAPDSTPSPALRQDTGQTSPVPLARASQRILKWREWKPTAPDPLARLHTTRTLSLNETGNAFPLTASALPHPATPSTLPLFPSPLPRAALLMGSVNH